jgi:hypothetical protein
MVENTETVTSGFSERFVELLDRVNFPSKDRMNLGGQRFNVAPTTFRTWCKSNIPPRRFEDLVCVVTELLKDIKGEYDPQAVACWLYGGSSVPHPFEEGDIDFILKADLYLMVSNTATERHIILSPDSAKTLAFRFYHYVCDQRKKGRLSGSIRGNEEIIKLINTALTLEEAGISN